MMKFWLVWCPTGARPPGYRHVTEESARREAQRLASQNPLSVFFVVEAKTAIKLDIDELTSEDDIPF